MSVTKFDARTGAMGLNTFEYSDQNLQRQREGAFSHLSERGLTQLAEFLAGLNEESAQKIDLALNEADEAYEFLRAVAKDEEKKSLIYTTTHLNNKKPLNQRLFVSAKFTWLKLSAKPANIPKRKFRPAPRLLRKKETRSE